MGKIVQFSDHSDLDQLRANAYARYDAGHYSDAIDLFEQYFAAGGNPKDLVRERKALARLGRAYIKMGNPQAAEALAYRNMTALCALQFGRSFLMDIGVEIPNFEFCQRAILNAFDEDEADLFGIRLNNVVRDYRKSHGPLVTNTVRRVGHIGAFPLYEQEQVLRSELPRIPVTDAMPAVVQALSDKTLHPFVRTTLIAWARDVGVSAELHMTIQNHEYGYNPHFAKPLGEDLASRAVRKAVRETGGVFPDDMVQLLLGMVYPVAEKVITDPEAFAATLCGTAAENDSGYTQLVAWMNAQAELVSAELN